ncbi:MAG: NAD(P)-dependent oxidoreductase [Chloroflexota bacterium]
MTTANLFISGTITESWRAKLAHGFTIDYVDRSHLNANLGVDELRQRVANAHVLITELDEIDAQILDHASNLAAIVDCRAAVVNIDIKRATELGIAVMNTPGRNCEAVADLTVALMVMSLRKVETAMHNLRANRWQELGKVQTYINHRGHEMPGKQIGLIGLGAVGRAVAKRLTGFDVQILGYDPFVKAEDLASLDIELVALESLLRASDIVSLHAPVTAATRSMIGTEALNWMKPSSYLINTARADLVDESAMITALKENVIAGAALDVFHEEPVELMNPLFAQPNVIALPHIGGATYEVVEHQSRLAYSALHGLLAGKPYNVVNQEAFSTAQARLGALGIELPSA